MHSLETVRRDMCRGGGPAPTGCKMANLTGQTLVRLDNPPHADPCSSLQLQVQEPFWQLAVRLVSVGVYILQAACASPQHNNAIGERRGRNHVSRR